MGRCLGSAGWAVCLVMGLLFALFPWHSARADPGCEPESVLPECQSEAASSYPVAPIPRSVWLHAPDPSALPSVQSLLDEVLDHVVPANRESMMDSEIRIHVVPRDRNVTDLDPWEHLRGVPVPGGSAVDARTYDDVRGIGPAVCSDGLLEIGIAEEQVVDFTDGTYPSPPPDDLGRNLVHELGHAVECALTADQRAALTSSYAAARQRSPEGIVGRYPAYSVANQREYFAEGTAAWFELGHDDGSTYRRSWLADHDPALHGLLADVYAVPPRAAECDGLRATSIVEAGNEGLAGTPGPDVIVGSDAPDVINGGGGADVICGGGGDDALYGSYGDDRLLGGPGDDLMAGGTGDDATVDAEGSNEIDDDADGAGSGPQGSGST